MTTSTPHSKPGSEPTAPSSPIALALAFACGLVFAAALVMSGMTQPAKIMGFLDFWGMAQGAFPGRWDPTLAFVMGGSVVVTLVGFAWASRPGAKPWLAEKFVLPTRVQVDTRLVVGSALFGVGWGLAGYCPGPALASLISGGLDALVFVSAMLIGMLLTRLALRPR